MVGFPQTEIHVEKLKEYGFNFDRLLFLTDLNEEEPGKAIVDRYSGELQLGYDWEGESEVANKILTVVQEIMTTEDRPGEEAVKKIDCAGSEEDVWIKIRTELDPFFCQPDKADDV